MDLQKKESLEQSKKTKLTGHVPRMRTANAFIVTVAAIMSLMLLQTTERAATARVQMRAATDAYIQCSTATYDLGDASDYLTNNARLFSITYETGFVANYYNEVNIAKRRDEALLTLESYSSESTVRSYLAQALEWSNKLAEQEGHAMRLIAEGRGLSPSGNLAPLADYELTDEDLALTPDEMLAEGQELLFGEEYRRQKSGIDSFVAKSSAILIEDAEKDLDQTADDLEKLLVRQRILTILLLVAVITAVYMFISFVLRPLASFSSRISDGLSLVPSGSQELRLFAKEYNILYEENRRRYGIAQHKADHDHLTGLYNRGAYDALLQDSTTNVALMLVDVDYFKNINDTYGHETGDNVLRKVADLLTHAFRNTDFVCRIGGDEFAVIITNITPDLTHIICDKIMQIREGLKDSEDGLPTVTLSIGVAFSNNDLELDTNLFERADRTLYVVKNRGRDGYAFADSESDA